MFSIYDKERRKQLHKEIKTLSSVECEALITFYGAFHKEGNIGVILEYMDRGSLEFIVEPAIRLTDLSMACITYQVTGNQLNRSYFPDDLPLDHLGSSLSSL
jgi:serine/threonine protein kinase